MADAGDEMMLDGEEGVEDILQVDSPMDPPIDLLSTPGSPSAPPPPQHDDSSTLPREKRLEYSDQLPYACESLEEMDARLELIVRRLVECVRAREWEVGWTGWNYRLDCWMGMKYPLPLPLRTRLAALYYEVCVLPGMDPRLIDGAVNMFISLVESKKRLERKDLTLPWKPLYDILSLELFPKNRKTDHTTISASLLLLCEHAQRFFPVTPNTVKEILSTFLPKLEGNHLNSLISTQAFLVHFLPMSERNAIELVLPVVFRLWEAFNTRIWDEQWLDLCARAGERVAKNEAEESGREGKDGEGWKDVGIFSEEQWEFICTKLLRGMGVPIGTGRGNIVNVATNDHFSDQKANGTSLLMKKPTDKIQSFSTILVYSMSVDSVAASASIEKGVLTPATGVGTPRLSRTNTSSAGTATNGGVGGNLLVAALAGSGKEKRQEEAEEMVTSTFYRRWMEEQRPKCKTPTGRRITKEIKREFVLTMRTVALLSMFSKTLGFKDGLSSLAGMAALKNMALLEPDLIFPAILEPLASVSQLLFPEKRTQPARSISFPSLSFAFLDWMSTTPIRRSRHACSSCRHVGTMKIEDLTRLEGEGESGNVMIDGGGSGGVGIMDGVEEGMSTPALTVNGDVGEVHLTKAQENAAVRVSTAGFPEWVDKLGGKSEEKMIHTMIAAMDAVCNHLSPELFDLALDIFYEHCATSVRSNSAKAVGDFVTCFARASPEKTLARFLPLCMRKIKEELEHGAASTRTTSPNSVLDSDVTLSYYSGLMVGSIHHGGVHMLKYKQDIFNLLRLTVEKSMTERAFSYNGRFISNLIIAWTHIWPHDYRFVNSEEWNSSHFAKKHHEMWGKTYKSAGRQASSDLVDLGLPKKLGKDVTDMWLQEPEFVERVPAFACGINITDPSDPRHTYMLKLRERYGETLHNAIDAFKSHGVEDSIDCVRLLISSIKSILIDYPCDRSTYGHMQRYFDFTKNLCKNWKGQQLYPRAVWIRRALYYHSARQRIYSLARPRSQLEDQLILDLGELSLSPYLKVRLSSQRALDSVTIYYDGSRALLYDTLFDALKPGNDHDRMKGALYVLGSKLFCNLGIVDWRFAPKYIMSLLGCHHQERPSVQSLAKGIIHDFIIRLGEPSSLRSSVSSSGVQTAANELEKHSRYVEDKGLIERISGTRAKRVEHRDQAYLDLIPELLKFAQEPGRHWRYRLAAIRFIRTLIRRDMPLNPGTAAFMVNQMVSDIPTIRAHSLAAVTKMLHFLKLRSLPDGDTDASGSSELLLLQKTRNPLKRRVHLDVPVPDDFTDKFIRSLKEPITSGSKEETHLMDKTVIGWLVWGSEVEFYAAPPDGAPLPTWDSTSQAATEELRKVIHSQKWWDDFSAILAQEHTRDYLGNDNATVIKSIFQIFQDAPLEFLFPVLEKFIEEEDRHKQRAAGELLGGLLRGSKHWPKERLQRIWNWLTPRLSKIYDKVTPDTQNSWEMFYDYVLYKRDPRRNLPLIEYVTSLRIDPDSSHAFSQAKAQYLVGSVMKSLSWHFLPWSESYIAEYWDALDNPFSEVRNAVADNLKYLSETRLHPSYTSIPSLVRDCHNSTTGLLLIGQDNALEEKFDQLTEMLKQWRRVRKPSNTGSQRYDNGAMTILNWLFQGLHDFRFAILLPYVLKLLPELFRMQEILDNDVALYFHNLFLIDDTSVQEIMDLLWELLRDPKIEVREAAATSLSGIVRCSQRQAILMLRERFMAIVKKVKLPARRTAPGYQDLFIMAHSGVLGCAALIDAFPYEVPPWMPDTLISMGEFKSHQDSWQEDQKAFTEEQSMSLRDLLVGGTFYA
ncbi:hypothetical protein BT69DRAFT_1292546 [Atractiella rhizophila]|nr:hypothetical protein BT69DRAFT_1292546 [Atractiella rhizophila]